MKWTIKNIGSSPGFTTTGVEQFILLKIIFYNSYISVFIIMLPLFTNFFILVLIHSLI